MIACDIDGTILFQGETRLNDRLFPIIRRLQSCGVEYLSCSGRQYANQRRLFAPVADEISYICENGSLTMHRGQAVGCEVLDRARALELLRFIQQQPECEGLLSTAENYGGTYKMTEYAPPAINDEELFRLSGCGTLREPLLCADDFSVYGFCGARALYMLLGTGDTPPLHSPYFDFDDDILPVGTEEFIALCKNEKISNVV